MLYLHKNASASRHSIGTVVAALAALWNSAILVVYYPNARKRAHYEARHKENAIRCPCRNTTRTSREGRAMQRVAFRCLERSESA